MNVIQFKEATNLLGLDAAIEYRNKYNPSNDLPYHNTRHMDFMLSDCINAFLYSRLTVDPFTPGVGAPHYAAIFYAAIFHDCDHSGGKLPDSQNIDKAIAFWKKFVDSDEAKTIYQLQGREPNEIKCLVPLLLKATQYPYIDILETEEYKSPQHPALVRLLTPSLVASGAILRDADLMTIYHGVEGFKFANVNLYKEMSAEGGIYSGMTYADYTVKQKAFLENVKWHSKWGQQRAVVMNHRDIVSRVIFNLELRI